MLLYNYVDYINGRCTIKEFFQHTYNSDNIYLAKDKESQATFWVIRSKQTYRIFDIQDDFKILSRITLEEDRPTAKQFWEDQLSNLGSDVSIRLGYYRDVASWDE